MLDTEFKLEFSVEENKKSGIPVIIVAAGMSSRMGGIDKQAALICGIPVLARTLMVFENSKNISEIILVVKESEILNTQLLCEKYGISKQTDIVAGGDNRQQSVLNGFKMLGEAVKSVLIHDGARPLVSNEVIKNVTDALISHSAVTCAVPVKDTIKQIDKDGKIVNTPDRASLVAVQTPQGVRVEDYKNSLEKAVDLSLFTDDMSLMEAAGYEAYTVMGSYSNIKITTPEDLILAENILLGENEI